MTSLATLVFWVGNKNPSITETITIDGAPVNLTGSTVKFRMRAVGSDVLKVDAAAVVNTPATAGNVQYNWQTADVDTAGTYLCWWVVQAGSLTQDVNEAVIVFREHAQPSVQPAYVELEDFKKTLALTGNTFADVDCTRVLLAASRGIEEACNRRFWKDADNTSVRVYTPDSAWQCEIDDCCDIQAVKIDRAGTGSYTETWTLGREYVLWPTNAAANYVPHETIRVREQYGFHPTWLPCADEAVQVTGQFGWSAVPPDIEVACIILASRMLKRAREAPFGVVFSMGLDNTAAVRIAKTDPEVAGILANYTRHRPFA